MIHSAKQILLIVGTALALASAFLPIPIWIAIFLIGLGCLIP